MTTDFADDESIQAANSSGWTRRFLSVDAAGAAKRLDIEGMRAVAVLLVMAYHAHVPVHGGRVGVDVFFVISGFIITGALIAEIELHNTISLTGFYARRAKRLLPAAGLVIAVTLVLVAIFIPRIRWSGIAHDALSSTFYVQNWRLASQAVDYTQQGQAHSPLQHFWSLGVEEQFYLIWPALLLIVTFWPKRRREGAQRITSYRKWAFGGMMLVAIPSLAYSIIDTHNNPAAAYYSSFTRLWELALGGGVAIAAVVLAKVPKPLAAICAWIGLAVTIWSAFHITDATPFPGSWALAPTLGAAAVLGFGAAAGNAGPVVILGLRPLVFIGGLSYSLYLWHWPLINIYEARYGTVSATGGVVIMLVASVVAWLSLKFIENPVRFRPAFTIQPTLALQTGFMCMLATAVVALALGVSSPRVQPLYSQPVGLSLSSHTGTPLVGAEVLGTHPHNNPAGNPVNTASSINPDPQQAFHDDFGFSCVSRATVTVPAPCQFGDPTSTTHVALVGDSHAAQWVEPLDAIAKANHWALTLYSLQNCSWTPTVLEKFQGRTYNNCQTWGQNVSKALAAHPPAMLIVSDVRRPAFSSSGTLLRYNSAPVEAAFEHVWAPLISAGTKVVVLADIPRPKTDEHICVYEHESQLTKCAFPRHSRRRDNGAMDDAAKATKGVTYLDLTDEVCPDKSCAAVIGDIMVYRDTNHLTATYAGTIAPILNSELPKLPKAASTS